MMKNHWTVLVLALFLLGLFAYSNFFEKDRGSLSDIVIRVQADTALTPRPTTPQNPDGPDSNWYYSEPLEITEATTVTGFDIEMEDGDLSSLHHASVVLVNRPAVLCAEHFARDGGGFEIYSSSRLTATPISLPEPYGVFLESGDRIVVEFMEHTQAYPHSATPENKEFTPTLKVTLHTDTQSIRTTPVEFVRLRLDDTPCEAPLSHQAFSVPAAAENFVRTSEGSEASASYTFESDGKIIFSGANFWPRKGGESVTAKINGTQVHTFTAEKSEDPWDWDILHSAKEIAVSAGDVIDIESKYTNPFDTDIKDASAMYGFYFATE